MVKKKRKKKSSFLSRQSCIMFCFLILWTLPQTGSCIYSFAVFFFSFSLLILKFSKKFFKKLMFFKATCGNKTVQEVRTSRRSPAGGQRSAIRRGLWMSLLQETVLLVLLPGREKKEKDKQKSFKFNFKIKFFVKLIK